MQLAVIILEPLLLRIISAKKPFFAGFSSVMFFRFRLRPCCRCHRRYRQFSFLHLCRKAPFSIKLFFLSSSSPLLSSALAAHTSTQPLVGSIQQQNRLYYRKAREASEARSPGAHLSPGSSTYPEKNSSQVMLSISSGQDFLPPIIARWIPSGADRRCNRDNRSSIRLLPVI